MTISEYQAKSVSGSYNLYNELERGKALCRYVISGMRTNARARAPHNIFKRRRKMSGREALGRQRRGILCCVRSGEIWQYGVALARQGCAARISERQKKIAGGAAGIM